MTIVRPAIPVIASIGELGSRYAAWLVDIWGVMHDGLRGHSHAVAATKAYRDQGGIVVLLSNSPRPSPSVQEQLRSLGVPDDAYDGTVTSGDLTRHELGKHPAAHVFHLGPSRDLPIFAGLDIELTDPAQAELVVCTGLFDDETETPDDYLGLLNDLAARDLPMICANPDHLVERGRRLVYCAGALAAVYERMGGSVVYAGKPYPPIYDLALETISELAGRRVEGGEILAIGDGINTDMAGAANFGLDAVFVASGLHVETTGERRELSEAELAKLFAGAKPPLAAMRELTW